MFRRDDIVWLRFEFAADLATPRSILERLELQAAF
jgi:hypothetical protein